MLFLFYRLILFIGCKKNASDVIFPVFFAHYTLHIVQYNISIKRFTGKEQKVKEYFKEMVMRNKGLIWYVCNDFDVGKAMDIKDKYQEVVYQLWKDYPQFDSRYPEAPWVYAVAKNTMLMLKRKNNIEFDTINNDMEVGCEAVNEQVEQLWQMIDSLNSDDRKIVTLYLEGYSYEEIAAKINASKGTVAMRLSRIKKKLKNMYENER